MAIKTTKTQGFTIIEIATVILIIGVGIFSLISLGSYLYRSIGEVKRHGQASLLAAESMEAVRSFRDATEWDVDGLGAIPAGGSSYYPEIVRSGTSTEWQLSPGEENLNGFRRRILIDNVSRDPATADPEAAYNPAHNDPLTRQVTARIDWKNNSVILSQFLTDWKK